MQYYAEAVCPFVGWAREVLTGSIMLEIESNLLAFGKHWTLGNLFFNTFTKQGLNICLSILHRLIDSLR